MSADATGCMYCGREARPLRLGMVLTPVCLWCTGRWREDRSAVVGLSVRWQSRWFDAGNIAPPKTHDIRVALGDDAFSPAEAVR